MELFPYWLSNLRLQRPLLDYMVSLFSSFKFQLFEKLHENLCITQHSLLKPVSTEYIVHLLNYIHLWLRSLNKLTKLFHATTLQTEFILSEMEVIGVEENL